MITPVTGFEPGSPTCKTSAVTTEPMEAGWLKSLKNNLKYMTKWKLIFAVIFLQYNIDKNHQAWQTLFFKKDRVTTESVCEQDISYPGANDIGNVPSIRMTIKLTIMWTRTNQIKRKWALYGGPGTKTNLFHKLILVDLDLM
uniref:Uncharacterized protein n=1 Tax=Cacopsylla melanoneura TaxID=428564 RepID=A0A8D8YBH5_9HEMI